MNYPECDQQVASKALLMWGNSTPPHSITEIQFEKGKIYWGGALSNIKLPELYPNYDVTAEILKEMGVQQDFESNGPIRYTHRSMENREIYFVSNKTNERLKTSCTFRVGEGTPELWEPLSGETRSLPEFVIENDRMNIPLQFGQYQSYFIVFDKNANINPAASAKAKNFSEPKVLMVVNGLWNVSFDPKWGGPKNVVFNKLEDWTISKNNGIKYYSGIATYRKNINLPKKTVSNNNTEFILDLGEVNNLARVRINGKDMGVVWTAPYRLNISDAIHPGNNQVEIVVANLWPNRLIGDEQFPDDGIKDNKWPDWLLKNQPRTSGRYTFTTAKFYKKDSPLLKSGLIGPVRLLIK